MLVHILSSGASDKKKTQPRKMLSQEFLDEFLKPLNWSQSKIDGCASYREFLVCLQMAIGTESRVADTKKGYDDGNNVLRMLLIQGNLLKSLLQLVFGPDGEQDMPSNVNRALDVVQKLMARSLAVILKCPDVASVKKNDVMHIAYAQLRIRLIRLFCSPLRIHPNALLVMDKLCVTAREVALYLKYLMVIVTNIFLRCSIILP